MNSSLSRFLQTRAHYIHVSKPLVTIRRKIGGIEFKKRIVNPAPGVTRFTNPEAFKRLGSRGKLYERE